MSEFTCRNNHLMPTSAGLFCPECGLPPYRMDGFTSKELEMQEKEDFDEQFNEEEDEDELI